MAKDFRKPSGVPKPVAARLSLYLRHLEGLPSTKVATISSRQLGVAVGCTAAQVRKDLAYFGQLGRRGIGYGVVALAESLRSILGTNRLWPAALVGVGNLGSALLAYQGFAVRGFRITAAFDRDPAKIGRSIAGTKVMADGVFGAVVKKNGIGLAIIAVDAPGAQAVADMITRAGIRGILNFAPVEIRVPDDVILYSVDVAVPLEQITYHLKGHGAKHG